MTGRRFGAKVLAAALALPVGAMLFVPPAGAIQTTTWGIQPAAAGAAPRGSLQYPSNGETVHDAVVVYNRTDQPEVLNLSVLAASYRNSAYQYTPAVSGLAAGISLAATRISLAPNQEARVPVTIRMPRHSKVTTLAAISAEGAPVKQGSFLVQQQLVILVKATPSTSAPIVPDIGLWGPAAGGLLALVAGLLVLELRKRKRLTAAAGSPDRPRPVPEPEPAVGVR